MPYRGASPERRVEAVIFVPIATLLLILSVGIHAAWYTRQGATTTHHGSLIARRGEQLACAAVSEAVDAVERVLNDPHPTPAVVPGGATGSILDSWFRLVRPAVSTLSPPSIDPANPPTIEVVPAATAALAAAEGFALVSPSGSANVQVKCLASKQEKGVHQGVLELVVIVTGGRGPWIVRRRLVERRVFYALSTDLSASGDGCDSASEPNCVRSTVCRVLDRPLGRVHDTPPI